FSALAALVLLAIGSPSDCHGQSSPTGLSDVFEVASVRPNKTGAGRHLASSPGQIHFTSATLQDCIKFAYGVRDYQISGPDWLNTERYDVIAKASTAVPTERLKTMLQALLGQRFELRVHREKKSLPVYALLIARGGS